MFSLPDNPRELVREVWRGYARVDLLTYANAIAFQILFALIPLAMLTLAALGLFGFESVYDREVEPPLRESTSPEVFVVLDDALRSALNSSRGFWLTAGVVFTVWKISGAMRAVMGVFERIYDENPDRSAREKYVRSTWLSVAAMLPILGAVAAVRLLPALAGWPLAIVLMLVTVALIVHFAPDEEPPWQFVTLGAVIVVVAWVGSSVAFGFYVSEIADFGSVFGNLATVIITFEYVYIAATAFLTGALLDQIIRDRDG